MPKDYEWDGDAPPRRSVGEDGARVSFGEVEVEEPQPRVRESPTQIAIKQNRFQNWLAGKR